MEGNGGKGYTRMRANASDRHELERMETEGEAPCHPSERGESKGAEAEERHPNGAGGRRARSERGARRREDLETDKRTRGAVDGVRSGGRRREGLHAGLQTGKPALRRRTDGGSCASQLEKMTPREMRPTPPEAAAWRVQWPRSPAAQTGADNGPSPQRRKPGSLPHRPRELR